MDVPEGWSRSRVGVLGDVQAGKAKNKDGAGSQRPYLRVANVFDGYIDVSDVYEMPFTDAEFERYVLREGDILLNEGQSLDLVGRCAMYRGEFAAPCAIQNALIRFRAGEFVQGNFAHHLFRWCQATGVFAAIATQTTSIAHLGIKRLSDLEVLVPPLAEQKKIAGILTSVDEAIQATQAVIDQTRKVKQGLLQQLLTRGIGHTRFKQTEIGEIPESWEVARVGDHCSLVTKGTTPKPEQQHAGSGEIPYLKVYNLNREGQVDFSIRPTFIDRAVHDAALRRSRAYPGDVLMNIVGPPLKQVAIVPATYPEWNLNQAIAIFRCTDSLISGYLHACLSSEHLFKWARVRAKRTSGQANLTLELCANFPIPLPPPNEQREISERLSDLDSAISAQRDHSRRLARYKTGLMNDLLSGRVRVKVSP